MLGVEIEQVGHWLAVQFDVDALTDAGVIQQVTAEINKRVDALPPRGQIAISFKGVEFVSSQMIGALLGIRAKVQAKHGRLVLCRVGPHLQDALRITGLTKMFETADSLRSVVGTRQKARVASATNVDWMD